MFKHRRKNIDSKINMKKTELIRCCFYWPYGPLCMLVYCFFCKFIHINVLVLSINSKKVLHLLYRFFPLCKPKILIQYQSMVNQETYFALSTPSGRSATATIRLSGQSPIVQLYLQCFEYQLCLLKPCCVYLYLTSLVLSLQWCPHSYFWRAKCWKVIGF